MSDGIIPTIIGGAVALKILDVIPEKKRKRKKKKVSHKTRKKLKKVM